MDDPDPVIRTNNLTCYYGRKRALLGLNLSVPRGSIFAFLGRNGSGKTTTIRALLGLLEPTRGSASVLGFDCRKIPPAGRGRIGYLAEGHPVYGWMRVRECGRFQSRFYPRWNEKTFHAVAGHFRLDAGARARNLSRGQRAGLCLALALAPEPELFILDDPALGLDPVARRSFLEAMVYVTREAGRTVFFSSHIVSDVERVADHIAVLDDGILKAHCPVETFQDRVRRYTLRFPGAVPDFPGLPGLLQAEPAEGEMRLTLANPGKTILTDLKNLGASSVEEVPLSLEDALIAFLGARGERRFFLGDANDAPEEKEAV